MSGGTHRHRPALASESLHQEAASRLGDLDQRYTTSRRALVDVLAAAARPLTMPEILAAAAVPQSSAYRNLTVLCLAGVVSRLAGADDLARFELAEDLSGHHHHLTCGGCGLVADVDAPPALERALAQAARAAASETGFVVSSHRIELEGRCPACAKAQRTSSTR